MRMLAGDEPRVASWLTAAQAAVHMGFAVQTLANWRALGKGPTFVRVGRSVRYARSEIDRFMQAGDGR